MYLIGATLTKFLATLAAMMTVTAGLPSSQCRCPDGRVMLFCQGTASSNSCCCAEANSPSSETTACCCKVKRADAQKPQTTKKHSCCPISQNDSQNRAGSGGSQIVVKAACCEKTVVTATQIPSIVDPGFRVHQLVVTSVHFEPVPTLTPIVASGATADRSPPGLLASPPDRVIIFCHLTC
jgi:hypothetical protein